MRESVVFVLVTLLFCTGCATYVGTRDVASQLAADAVVEEDPTQAVITGGGHKVVLESGTSLVFVDDSPVLLNHPTRLENGKLVVSNEIFEHLPQTPVTKPGVKPRPTRPRPQRPYKLRTIVIDAGHGGDQSGALYSGVPEKMVALDIALQVAAELRAKGMQVILTRTSDRTVSLAERSAVANTSGADCFVSIHADAAANTAARGIEVFHLAETFVHKSKRYNDSSRAMEINRRRAADKDLTGSDAFPPAVSGWQLAKRRRQSEVLAKKIEGALIRRLQATSRGLKTAGLAVLKWTASPAVLVEVGFLSNPDDRMRLREPAYRSRVAAAVAGGILDFREWYELAN